MIHKLLFLGCGAAALVAMAARPALAADDLDATLQTCTACHGENGRPASVRERLEQHRRNPVCSSCHSQMDPLGFALENFDATGRWRDRDRYAGVAIDAAGKLPDGTPVNSPDDVRNALLRKPEQFAQTFTEGLLTYATGRKLEPSDMPTVRRIVHGAAASDYRFSTIVQAIVKSDQFQLKATPRATSQSTIAGH